MTCFRFFCMKKRRNTDADLSKKVETGNRIIRADYKEGTDGTIVLYRGIQPNFKDYKEHIGENNAKKSIIPPKNPLNDTLDKEAHIEGNVDGQYTSWTPSWNVAKAFSDNGMVMKGVFKVKDLIHPIHDFEGEREYTVLGTVVGAQKYSEQPNLTIEEKNKISERWQNQAKMLFGKKREVGIHKEYTPDGEVVRVWKEEGWHKQSLVSGVGVAKEEKMKDVKKRANSFHELKHAKNKIEKNAISSPPQKVDIKNSESDLEVEKPKEKVAQQFIQPDDISKLNRLRVSILSGLPKHWQDKFEALANPTVHNNQAKSSHKKKVSELRQGKIDGMEALFQSIIDGEKELRGGKKNVDDVIVNIKEKMASCIQHSNEYQDNRTLNKLASFFSDRIKHTKSKVVTHLEKILSTTNNTDKQLKL
jgi:hypothetical protein